MSKNNVAHLRKQIKFLGKLFTNYFLYRLELFKIDTSSIARWEVETLFRVSASQIFKNESITSSVIMNYTD